MISGRSATPDPRHWPAGVRLLVVLILLVLTARWAGPIGLEAAAGSAAWAAEPAGSTGTAAIRPDPTLRIAEVAAPTAERANDDGLLSGVFSDLNRYWAAELPPLAGRALTPLRGGYQAIDSSAPDSAAHGALCGSLPSGMVGNAYYCPAGDGIIVDTGALVPVLVGHYGAGGLVASLAHEFGHAVQARIGPSEAQRAATPAAYPSVLIEAGGDCYAGAFLAWVVSGQAPHLTLRPPDLLNAVGPLVDFRDSVTTSTDSPTAHGLGLDRLAHLLLGYRSGPAACHHLTASTLDLTLGRPGVSTSEAPARFSSSAAAMAAARRSVSAFAARSRLSAAVPSASASEVTAAQPYGQFALAAVVARSTGVAAFGNDQGATCFTGAWTASVFGKADVGALGSWAGDADEALDYVRARPGATFTSVVAFSDGFAQGIRACHR